MIHRVGEGYTEGDIIEFNRMSEPLYLYHDGELDKITPQEFNYLNSRYIDKRSRGYELRCFRNQERKYT